MRDSPSLAIVPALQDAGASIRAYDPEGMHEAQKLLSGIEYAGDAYDALDGADVLVFCTEWNQFRSLDWPRVRQAMPGRVVVDLRNIYDPATVAREGFAYHSIGRPAVMPS
jgi:UDPglucose 6-dehydrogenase